jgi:hypothetical protein
VPGGAKGESFADFGEDRRGADQGDGPGCEVRQEAQADGASDSGGQDPAGSGRGPRGDRAELQREPLDDLEALRSALPLQRLGFSQAQPSLRRSASAN